MKFNRPLLAMIVLVAAVVAGYVFTIPAWQQAQATSQQLQQAQADYQGKSDYYAQVAQDLQQLTSRQDQLAKVQDALPDSFSLSPVLSFLDQAAAANGLIDKSVQFSQSSAGAAGLVQQQGKTGQVQTISLDVELAGNYEGLKGFLRSLESSARLFEVDTISFSSVAAAQSKGSAAANIYDFKLSLKTHSY